MSVWLQPGSGRPTRAMPRCFSWATVALRWSRTSTTWSSSSRTTWYHEWHRRADRW